MALQDSDCSICLQNFVHPVQLPCGHIFCFLCIKGCAFHRRRCPMCRSRFSVRFFEDPKLVVVPGAVASTDQLSPPSSLPLETRDWNCNPAPRATVSTDNPPIASGYSWFYEGYAGWWQYDERTSEELEEAFMKQLPSCDISVAGYVYTVDFGNMSQKRKDNSGRKRRIKRDVASCEKKGVAGIKLVAIQTGSGCSTMNIACTTNTTTVNNTVKSTTTAPSASRDHTDALLPSSETLPDDGPPVSECVCTTPSLCETPLMYPDCTDTPLTNQPTLRVIASNHPRSSTQVSTSTRPPNNRSNSCVPTSSFLVIPIQGCAHMPSTDSIQSAFLESSTGFTRLPITGRSRRSVSRH
ncbi:E3 ubiquitin-protein ligase RNF146 [Paragonimus westermani]|uniref:E3 ubiquitin-protein ligase n=1 Tax=Paragonimus westermani TaxID=34504 RepID=A0A5J4NKU1_9TREM|nr:E3 ubiquitin-protein ligase RNF146 [Paragonimus westermani]